MTGETRTDIPPRLVAVLAGCGGVRGAEVGEMNREYPPTRCIAVDVDDTLFMRGSCNRPLVDWIRQQKDLGFDVILWSARGRHHAENAAKASGTQDLWTAIIGKPGYIVDDKGWTWINRTKRIRKPIEIC